MTYVIERIMPKREVSNPVDREVRQSRRTRDDGDEERDERTGSGAHAAAHFRRSFDGTSIKSAPLLASSGARQPNKAGLAR
jgi:hypothetical protein